MSKVLFEVTEDNLETGMRGYPVGYCTTSHVDPQKGLFYVGKPISEMKDAMPMDIIYLIYHGKEGTPEKVKAFDEDLKKRERVSKEVLEAIYALPKSGHPMDIFCASIQILGMFEGKNDYREDTLNMIAKIPFIAAAVINHHAGWGELKEVDTNLEYMEKFTALLNMPGKDSKVLTELMKLFNILHYDHGGGNLSAFVGKTIASGHQHLYGALSGAMNALAGPKHGRANQDSLEFVKSTLEKVGENAKPEDVEKFMRDLLARKELAYGFGHAVLRVEDARATILYDFASKNFPDHPLVKTAFLLRTEGPKVLSENPKISNPYPNVDAISGTVLTAGGFLNPEYYTILFGISRCIGIAIQIIYERMVAREGKGTPIVRPKYLYKSMN